jgi:hypothetical protein
MVPVAPAGKDYARTCFVIMPYGVCDVGPRRVNFDRVYDTIFKPAIRRIRLDGGSMIPVRADEPKHSRVLILEMIRDLLQSRLAIAEVSTENGNVYWEVGMRHLAVRSGTVLLGLKRRIIPFDIAPIMVNQYADTPPRAAEESVGAIAAVLRATLRKNEVDSPAFIGARRVAALIGTPEAPTPLGDAVADAELAVLGGASKDAASLYSKVVALAPDQPLLHQRQGTLYMQAGNRARAEESFLKVLAIDPANGDARRVLADLHQGRQAHLIAPDPLESPLLQGLVMKGIVNPLMMASAGSRDIDVSIFTGRHKPGEYFSTVRVIGDPTANVSPIREVLARHGFSSTPVAVAVPEANRTIYTFDGMSAERTQLQSAIGGLAQDLRSVPGVGKIDIGGKVGGGGKFGGGGSGTGGDFGGW